jgi:L-threonylcarbamoyladenylate synthase
LITKSIQTAKETLEKEDIIAIPTETVYGLAGNAFSPSAIKKIFELKQRPFFNPLIVHIKSIMYLDKIAQDIPEKALKLAEQFWPGPLTLVLKKKDVIPEIVNAGKDTVAIRIPNHPLTLDLLAQLDFPLAAPSANPFGSISPTSADHVHSYFGESLSVIMDGGECQKGIESTIVGFEGETPILYRLGSISVEQIESVVGEIKVINHSEKSPVAPGMLARHYAPITPTFLAENVEKMITENSTKKIGVLLFKTKIENENLAHQEILSPTGNLEEAAKNLYAAMHRLDKLNLTMIIAERFPNEGIGRAINDKLERAVKK